MTFEAVASLITVLGAGTILCAYFQSQFEHKKQVKEKEHELKSRRYKTILILMLTKLYLKNGLRHIAEFRNDLKNVPDVEKKIETELLNSVLFANDEVIKSLDSFVQEPSRDTYIKTAIAMRKNLWNRKTSIDKNIFEAIYIT
jgi:hypothetical protein